MGRRERISMGEGWSKMGEEPGSSSSSGSRSLSLGCTALIQATTVLSDLHLLFCSCRSRDPYRAACSLLRGKGTFVSLSCSKLLWPPSCIWRQCRPVDLPGPVQVKIGLLIQLTCSSFLKPLQPYPSIHILLSL